MEQNMMQYVHFWKTQISDLRLQKIIDCYSTCPKNVWLILLDEKLRRAEII